MPENKFTITKRISKHGKQAVIIVPSLLQDKLKPGTIAKIEIEILN
jgi:predicted RNA binding protein YcfA (HicA-like mRNA interferase family)